MNDTNKVELSYRSMTHADAPIVFGFLSTFMEQEFLMKRGEAEIEKLMEFAVAAFDDDQIVGFAAVEIYSRKLAELQCLAVSADYRRLGIGRQLVRWCCDLAMREGVEELMAISSSDAMFKACGFDYSLPNQKRALFFRAK